MKFSLFWDIESILRLLPSKGDTLGASPGPKTNYMAYIILMTFKLKGLF